MYENYREIYTATDPKTINLFMGMMKNDKSPDRSDGIYTINRIIMGKDSTRIAEVNNLPLALIQNIVIDGEFCGAAIGAFKELGNSEHGKPRDRFVAMAQYLVDHWAGFPKFLKSIGAKDIRFIWDAMKKCYHATWQGCSDEEISRKFKVFLMAHWFVICFDRFISIEDEKKRRFSVDKFLMDNEIN